MLAVPAGVHLLEGVGDVLQEDQAEHHVLVLGRVHIVAELVGRLPQCGLEAERGPVAAHAMLRFAFCHEMVLAIACTGERTSRSGRRRATRQMTGPGQRSNFLAESWRPPTSIRWD